MGEETVLTEADESVFTITLNRPRRRNAVDVPMAEALREAFEYFEQTPRLRVAVIHGAGD